MGPAPTIVTEVYDNSRAGAGPGGHGRQPSLMCEAVVEEGGTEPTIPLLRRLAAALDADVRLTAGHDLGSVWFETHAA
jgi:hypothetical protein